MDSIKNNYGRMSIKNEAHLRNVKKTPNNGKRENELHSKQDEINEYKCEENKMQQIKKMYPTFDTYFNNISHINNTAVSRPLLTHCGITRKQFLPRIEPIVCPVTTYASPVL